MVRQTMEIKVGQVYTFNDGETYDVIVDIKDNKIWYEIWQIKDLTYYNKQLNRYIIWSKALPNNEGTCVELEYMSPQEFEKLYKRYGKLLGEMNKHFGLNDRWHLVKKNKATRKWEPYKEEQNV